MRQRLRRWHRKVSIDLAAAFRRAALSLAQATSIRLRSGEYAARSAATSGRSCSLSCVVFLKVCAAIEEPPDHARRETLAVEFEEMFGDLGQRHVRRSLNQGEDLQHDARSGPNAGLHPGLPPHRCRCFATRGPARSLWTAPRRTGRQRPDSSCAHLPRPE